MILAVTGLLRPPEAPPSFDDDEELELLLSIVEALRVKLGEIRGFRTKDLIGSFSSLDC